MELLAVFVSMKMFAPCKPQNFSSDMMLDFSLMQLSETSVCFNVVNEYLKILKLWW